MLKKFKSEAGFTLIEIVFVVIILAILAGVALLSFGGLDTKAKDSVVEADFRTLATALKVYKAQAGEFPTDVEGLAKLTTDDAALNYIAVLDSVPDDPYNPGNSYDYDASDPDAVVINSQLPDSTIKHTITVK